MVGRNVQMYTTTMKWNKSKSQNTDEIFLMPNTADRMFSIADVTQFRKNKRRMHFHQAKENTNFGQ